MKKPYKYQGERKKGLSAPGARGDIHSPVHRGFHAGTSECTLKKLQSGERAVDIRIKFLRFSSQHCLHSSNWTLSNPEAVGFSGRIPHHLGGESSPYGHAGESQQARWDSLDDTYMPYTTSSIEFIDMKHFYPNSSFATFFFSPFHKRPNPFFPNSVMI